MNSQSGTRNYGPDKARDFAQQLVKEANASLESNRKMWLPPQNQTPVLPIYYQYVIATSTGYEADQGVYCHHNDEHYFFVSRGRNKNNYNRSVIRKYAVGSDSILNIFIMPHHPDSIQSSNYDVTSAGIALGASVKLSGIYETGKKPWQFKGLLNHEIGHVLGLRHTWSGNDGCEDTPNHPNCWNREKTAPCDTAASNNLMDYNANQHAWTPCQVGKIQMNMANLHSLSRKLLEENWCRLDESKTIEIQDSVVWNGSKDLQGHLVIAPGAVLRVRCRLSFPIGASLIVKAGGHLILDRARLHNACGDHWNGIMVESKGRHEGQITFRGDCSVEDTIW
ncbi:MAG: M43 family zinc metalloprotease [Saprospiraceae bacterium]|nr:M43 family zinc metalloprotease [Saprospiraceae bacterium]